MALLRKRNFWQRLFYSRSTIVVLLFLSILIAFAVYTRYKVEREVFLRRVDNEKELADLSKRKDELSAKINYLKEEQGIEAEIRQHFDVAREGEKVVVILDNPNQTDQVAPITETEPKPPTLWQKLLSMFALW